MNSLLGTKRGMTQIWREDGTRVPVTIVEVEPNVVCAVRTVENDGYEAVQLGYGSIRSKRVNKPQLGMFGKLDVEPRRHLREIRGPVGELSVKDEVKADLFEEGQLVDVIGTSKGKGFAGTIKRHGFARGPVSHGSQNVRRPGSIGMCKYPGRVIKGKRMAGRMGDERVTIRGLQVVKVDAENNRLLVKGAIPGANGGLVQISRSLKEKS